MRAIYVRNAEASSQVYDLPISPLFSDVIS